MIDLLANDERRRTRAIRELPASDPLRFALRRVLYTDPHAGVRAAAASRLGDFTGDVEPWLLAALAADASPLVRDTLLRSLARVGTAASIPALRALIAADRMWWVRRTAVYALAAIAGVDALSAFTGALADPFWRVRQAAVRVLAVLGARDPDVRDEVLATPPSSTLAFLRASWGPVAVEAPARAANMHSLLPSALLDPDPAVVTARLARASVSPLALVELLCDPHAPLRILAARRLLAANNPAAFEAALDWLEEPRIPHVVDTVHGLLDRLGDPATSLAARVLARSDRPGAAAWAIGWVVATRSESLYAAALRRARAGDTTLRRICLPIADDTELVAWAAADPSLRDAIATELHDRRGDVTPLDGTHHPRVRALQVDRAARTGRWDIVAAGATDPDHAPRAIAARWLSNSRSHADPDPAVREAALTPQTAGAALASDPDPWVRRAAIRCAADDPAVAKCALVDRDPWIRARACRRPIADDEILSGVLACLVDSDAAVRAAAHEAIATVPDDRIAPARQTGDARRGAYAWLLRTLDDAAVERARAALASETDPATIRLLAAVCGDAIAAPAVERYEPAVATRREVARRPFGRAGFSVAPLAISGAYDLSERSLALAHARGADLFFWEPGYSSLTRFLRLRGRRDQVRVVAGTYHADAASIRSDVDTALRRLRRDALDAFLLFWTRSPARLDAETFSVLDELRRGGKVRAIGFSTHHRDLARAAIEQQPWDVVMIRHSAAHPGIETELLPTARERGTAVLTFSALTYGRMLSGAGAPTAAECYRYSLSQPGVTAVISAPRRPSELVENLGVLDEPMLAAERIAALRELGLGVRAESQRFNTLLRQPTRDAAAAARELLASEPPPSDATRIVPLARSAGKRSRTRLGR